MQSDTSTEPSPLLAARMAGALWLVVILVSIGAILGDANLDMRGDPTKLNRETGWQPLVALDTTLTDVLAYWRSGAKRPV